METSLKEKEGVPIRSDGMKEKRRHDNGEEGRISKSRVTGQKRDDVRNPTRGISFCS